VSDARLSIDRIHEWIGPHRVLLPLPLGEKKPLKEGWQKTTFEETQTSEYQKELLEAFIRGGNIGVLLGNGLCAIDIDDDAFVDPFLSLNPALKDTLRSKGKDGCQIWVRIIGSYPEKICKLKTKGGTPWGEWRGGGGQSVIAGVHPESRPDRPIRYQRQVPKPAICVVRVNLSRGFFLTFHTGIDLHRPAGRRENPAALRSENCGFFRPRPVDGIIRTMVSKDVLGFDQRNLQRTRN
jgi:Bifunctional DNA primase/polymerase, N-terminal